MYEQQMSSPSITFLMPGLEVGGAERHTLDLRAGLAAVGYPSSLLVYGRGRAKQMMALPGACDAQLLDCRGPYDLASWARISSALKAANPDLLFAINQTPIITAVALKPWIPGKIVGVFHGTVPLSGQRLRYVAFSAASRFLDMMIYVSANQRSYWRTHGLKPRSDLTIVNGIDLDHFSPRPQSRSQSRQDWGIAEDDFVIGLLATFRPEKNHVQLVDALVELRAQGIPAKVVFVGDGPERARVTQYVEASGVSNHVVFTGAKADVRPAVAGFDVGVLCSVAIETMSLSALEIMAAGHPLVLSDTGGASEIVENDVNGYLFEVGRTDQLVDRLRRVAYPKTRQRLSAQATIIAQKFSNEKMLASYVDVIKSFNRPAR